MITFKQFINEESKFDLEQFKKDCKFAIDLCKDDNILYHGTKRYNENYSIEQWKEREYPKDSPKDVHNAVNAFFESKFGSPIRNWLFTCGKKSLAAGYGRGVAQAIFPIGRFNWVYSPDINDLSLHYENVVDQIRQHNEATGESLSYSDIQEQAIDRLLEHINDIAWIRDKNFPQAIASHNEIMIHCDKFYQFNTNGAVWRDIVKPYLNTL